MKARTLAAGAPSETTHSLQFPTHTFNLLALMQMLLRAEKTAELSLPGLTSLFKQNRNFISQTSCLHFPVNDDGTKSCRLLFSLYSIRQSSCEILEQLCSLKELNSVVVSRSFPTFVSKSTPTII